MVFSLLPWIIPFDCVFHCPFFSDAPLPLKFLLLVIIGSLLSPGIFFSSYNKKFLLLWLFFRHRHVLGSPTLSVNSVWTFPLWTLGSLVDSQLWYSVGEYWVDYIRSLIVSNWFTNFIHSKVVLCTFLSSTKNLIVLSHMIEVVYCFNG